MHTLSLGPLVLVGTQRGLLVDVTINTDLCESAGEATITAPEWQSLVATVDVLHAADRRHAEDRAEIERLTTENANLREFIAASEECAKADDVLWYADENERMRAEFTRMMRQLETNGEVQFNASGCEWCGAAWPKPEGDTAEQVHERARRHVYRCAKHPMKIERDALTEQVASLRSTVDALKQECRELTEQRDAARVAGSRACDIADRLSRRSDIDADIAALRKVLL